MVVRQMRSACAMNALPFFASRQAAVAIPSTRSTRNVSQSARNRINVDNAFSTASGASNPVDCTSRPRPASTFSLKIGVGVRVSAS